jgi:hypothetical protein
MSDDDPITSRTITTPKATITINSELFHVDEIYRLTNKALLATGKYTIPPPGSNPWDKFPTPQVHSPDFLRRRLEEVTRQLEEAQDRNAIQDLRSANHILEMERDEWRQAFIDQTKMIEMAYYSLRDDPEPNLCNAVARQFLNPE